MEAITAPGTQTVDCVYREPGAPVWNRYFHALATAGAGSVAVFFWFRHFVAQIERLDHRIRDGAAAIRLIFPKTVAR